MKQRYLEVTYRKGKPLAAYLYLPREVGATSARTEDGGPGLRVDYDANGKPIGLEITAPSAVTIADVNAVLARIGVPELAAEDWAPLRAA
ncbi:MAG: DUF2283 domain-containing protein [Candidatus Eisenbacteria bacterium]|nr:DUF2283 domain-containing protein [Candidatus Eisenbacteria bacterium]